MREQTKPPAQIPGVLDVQRVRISEHRHLCHGHDIVRQDPQVEAADDRQDDGRQHADRHADPGIVLVRITEVHVNHDPQVIVEGDRRVQHTE
ncbi:MAG: hypothetical protein MZV64_15585 [Ignavibacteriales bacterium]|nr:hypothetical protein [Ignavibacteriales bacterium]